MEFSDFNNWVADNTIFYIEKDKEKDLEGMKVLVDMLF